MFRTPSSSHRLPASIIGLSEPSELGCILSAIQLTRITQGHSLQSDHHPCCYILPFLSSTLTLLHSLHPLWPQLAFSINFWDLFSTFFFQRCLWHMFWKSMSQQFPFSSFLTFVLNSFLHKWGCKRQQVTVSFPSSSHVPLISITNTQIPASLPHLMCPTPNTQSIAGTMDEDCDQGFASSSDISGFSGEMSCQGVTSLWVNGKNRAGSPNLVSWQPCTIPTRVFMESLVSVPLCLHPLFTQSVSSSFPQLSQLGLTKKSESLSWE